MIPLADNVRSEPFRLDIRAAHRITDIATLYDEDPEFSRKIREHLPKRVRR